MKHYFRYIILAAALLSAMACSKPFSQSPYGENDGTAPGPVTVTKVENINGGAFILFDLPANDVDILYVKAVYQNSQNVEQNAIVSAYADTVKIEGLGDTKSRNVNLYSVDRYGNESVPTTATIEPLEPAVIATRNSLSAVEGFGGFHLSFTNEMRNPLSFYVYTWNEQENAWKLQTVSTSRMADGTLQIKGFDAVQTKFAVEVRDTWGNISDKYEFELTPLYEIKLDKTKFRSVDGLVGDCSFNDYSGHVTKMWNDVLNAGSEYGHTSYPVPTGWPHAFTVDLGVSAKLSQIAFWPRQDNPDLFFAHGFPYLFGVYGCPEDKDYRDFDNYVELYYGHTIRPSGLPFGDPNTEEDIQKGRDGQLFDLNQEAPAIRYMKFKSFMSWSGMECTVIAEITLWGAPVSNE
jgi:hypothetical protein